MKLSFNKIDEIDCNHIQNVSVMKLLNTIILFLSLLCYGSAFSQEAMSNKDIISMHTAKISDDIVITKIVTAKCSFDLTASGIIALNISKVSAKIIKAMFAASPPTDNIGNEDVLNMTNSKVPEDVIRFKILSSPHNFDITPDGLIKLKAGKVSKNVMKDMLANPVQTKSVKPTINQKFKN